MRTYYPILRLGLSLLLVVIWPAFAFCEEPADLLQQLNQLREQNRLLQQQLQQQQKMIDQLTSRFDGLQRTNNQLETDWRALKRDVSDPPPAPPEKSYKGVSVGNAVISGEGAVGFFETGKNGAFPNAELRVDEARLFVDAPLWEDVYFYGQLDLLTRESYDSVIQLGELYADFEDVSKLWGKEHLLNLRLGQLYTPFGEEYMYRFAMDDLLISHSLSDLWGLSPGLELYGNAGKFSYVLAVQNGGGSTLRDFTADKSITARLGYDPTPWLHLSVSAMRTGDLSVVNDGMSGEWFGGGWFTPTGSTNTSLFHVNAVEGDARVRWKKASFKLAGGYAGYGDNDPSANNHRDIYYYYAEWTQPIAKKLFGAARWSQIRAPEGYPVAGNSSSIYPGLPTKDIWRLSLGLGYRFNDHLLWKIEYSFEDGRLTSGATRSHENMFSTEAAFKF